VHVDAARRPLVRERLRQLRDAALASRVAGNADAALEREKRGDEHDLAAAALDHPPAELACEDERRAEVDLEHEIPYVVTVLRRGLALDGARVEDEDVDRPVIGSNLLGEGVRSGPVGKVARIRMEPAPERRDLRNDVVARRQRLAHAGDVGASVRERDGGRFADAAASSGDERGLAGQVEAHARQSTTTLMSFVPWASSSKSAGSRSSDSTRLISRSSGIVAPAMSSIARSKSAGSYTRAPRSWSSFQKKSKSRTGCGSG